MVSREYDRLSQGNSPKKQDRSLTELKKDIYEHLLKILQEEEILLKKQKMILEKISSGKLQCCLSPRTCSKLNSFENSRFPSRGSPAISGFRKK